MKPVFAWKFDIGIAGVCSSCLLLGLIMTHLLNEKTLFLIVVKDAFQTLGSGAIYGSRRILIALAGKTPNPAGFY
jgi:hypothetical protein